MKSCWTISAVDLVIIQVFTEFLVRQRITCTGLRSKCINAALVVLKQKRAGASRHYPITIFIDPGVLIDKVYVKDTHLISYVYHIIVLDDRRNTLTAVGTIHTVDLLKYLNVQLSYLFIQFLGSDFLQRAEKPRPIFNNLIFLRSPLFNQSTQIGSLFVLLIMLFNPKAIYVFYEFLLSL